MGKISHCLFALLLHPLWVQSAGMKPDRQVVYKAVGGIELKMQVFEPEGLKKSDKRPAIVFFFGGGWNSGSPKFVMHGHRIPRELICTTRKVCRLPSSRRRAD